MKSRFWKIGIAWCCVLIYLVIGAITLDSSDTAQAKATGQVSLLDRLDELFIDSVLEQLGIASPENESFKTLVFKHGDSEREIGLSIEGAAPGNSIHSNFKPVILAQTLFYTSSTNAIKCSDLVHSANPSRDPPLTTPVNQFRALETVILNL